jgi:hypothetical protein
VLDKNPLFIALFFRVVFYMNVGGFVYHVVIGAKAGF